MELSVINGRWRGRMPFRHADEHERNLLEQNRRTGEPSLADILQYCGARMEAGRGKARGSHTEKMRHSLWTWTNTRYGNCSTPLTFDYKLHRHKIITITGNLPYLRHLPCYGKGKRGFILEITILSIDGIPHIGARRVLLAWNRILSHERIFALPAGRSNGRESESTAGCNNQVSIW